jgi:hypothetical protein
VKTLHKTTRSSKISHQTTLKLQFSLTTSPTPIFQRKTTLPTKISHKTTKSARKPVPNNKFQIAKLRVPTPLKKLNYYPEPNKLARNRLFAHQNAIKLTSNSKFCIWTSTTFFRGSFQHFDTKKAKLPQLPASTDSNHQPTTSTPFSATTKILPKKNLPSPNSNPQPPNLRQNLSLPHN